MTTFSDAEAKRLAEFLRKKGPQMLALIRGHWVKSSFAFISLVVKTQMSGRPGLRRKTGALARSWFPLVQEIGKSDLSARVITDSSYARIHQYGGTIRRAGHTRNLKFRVNKRGVSRFAKSGKENRTQDAHVGSYAITIPKRLNVIEEFNVSGKKLYIEDVRQAMKEIVN